MITPKEFATLSSVWHTITPPLDQFTRWVNTNAKPYATPITSEGEAGRNALIAETAFEVFARQISVAEAEPIARSFIGGLPGQPRNPRPLNPTEKMEARGIARNLERHLPERTRHGLIVHPEFPGCGIVSKGKGDLVADQTLIEVKTVERGFRTLDFRQALTYCALAYASGLKFDKITLLNPRRAVRFTVETRTLAYDLGSASWIDLMQRLVNAMTDIGPSQ